VETVHHAEAVGRCQIDTRLPLRGVCLQLLLGFDFLLHVTSSSDQRSLPRRGD
jgi:hypothetical protein